MPFYTGGIKDSNEEYKILCYSLLMVVTLLIWHFSCLFVNTFLLKMFCSPQTSVSIRHLEGTCAHQTLKTSSWIHIFTYCQTLLIKHDEVLKKRHRMIVTVIKDVHVPALKWKKNHNCFWLFRQWLRSRKVSF